jgi:tripartite-type tricarboxylate transporter receptor subunit TctC
MARLFLIAGMLAILLGNSGAARAQDHYPSRPVRIIVSTPAASSPDIRARILADELGKTWGRPVVVENRAGGGGLIGAQVVISAEPDGYTLLGASASTFTILPAQSDRLAIDVNRDLVPVALIGSEGMVLAVSPKLGVASLAELIALAKTEPYRIIIGTNPAGSLPHLAARLLARLADAPITVVPSSGGTNEAIKEIIGGRVHAVIDSLPALRGATDAGEVKRWRSCCRNGCPQSPTCRRPPRPFPGSPRSAGRRSRCAPERRRRWLRSLAGTCAPRWRAPTPARGSMRSARRLRRSSAPMWRRSSTASRNSGGRS